MINQQKQKYEIENFHLYIYEEKGVLVKISFSPDETREKNSQNIETTLMKNVKEEITAYLKGKRKEFDIPLIPQGTTFQQKVWQEISKIPYGETRTYKELAERIGGIKCYQAIGQACRRNPYVIIVPCHRVVGSHSTLGGYAGGSELKQKLLNLEQKR